MVTINQIRKRLIDEINNAHISNAEICRRLGITTGALAQYKSGRSMPALDTLANLCKVIDVSPAYILFFEDESGSKTY
ncbi:MAG: helix-turn-helix transcriptional regulator [Clostridia bacterium]|jgi:transcriptional regulator with XRE-family HTH domain|nr:helix-turn-helix transcriptional regulator [Clostridia bacterium]